MKIWQAPLKSLYSLSFYREILESSIGTGLAYLAFLSLIASVLAGVSFNRWSIPESRELAAWLKSSAPALVFTSEGLQMKAPSPYRMRHPRYGPLVVIDLSKTEVGDKDFAGGAPLILTAKRGFFRSEAGVRIFDYNPRKKNFEPVPITGETFEKFIRILRLTVLVALPVIVFFFFFIWKFSMALIYSGLAVLINGFRRERLPYETLLNLSFFSMTAFVLLESLTFFIPSFQIRGAFFTGLAVTGVYLSIAILRTQPPLADEN